MSTKIYDAYRIKIPSGKGLLCFLDTIKTECIKAESDRIWKMIVEKAVNIIDAGIYHKVNNLPPENYIANIYECCGEDPYYREQMKKWFNYQYALNISKQIIKRKIESVDTEEFLTNLDYCISNSLCMFPFDDHIFLMSFGRSANNVMERILKNEEWSSFRQKYQLEDYHYQNQTDKPDDISESDWDKREADWKEAMPTGIPSADGICVEIIDSGFRLFTLSDKYKTETDISEYIPSKEGRINEISKKQAFKEYLEIHGFEEKLSVYSMFSKKIKKNDPEVAELLNKSIQIYENELPDITFDTLMEDIKNFFPEQ